MVRFSRIDHQSHRFAQNDGTMGMHFRVEKIIPGNRICFPVAIGEIFQFEEVSDLNCQELTHKKLSESLREAFLEGIGFQPQRHA